MPYGLEYIAELQNHISKGDIKILFDHDGTLIHSKDNEARRIHQYLQEFLPEEIQHSFTEVANIGYGYNNIWVPELIQALLDHNPKRHGYLIEMTQIAPYFFERLQFIVKRRYEEKSARLLQALNAYKGFLHQWIEQSNIERFSNLAQLGSMFHEFNCPEELLEIEEEDWLNSLKEAWANRLHKKMHAHVMDAITINVCRDMTPLPGSADLLEYLLVKKIDVALLSGNFADVVYTAMNYHFPKIACPYPRGESYTEGMPSPHCYPLVRADTLSTKPHRIKAFNNHFGLQFAHKPDPKGLLIQLCSIHHEENELQTNPQQIAKGFLRAITAGTLKLNYKTVYIGDDVNDLATAQNAKFDYFVAVETGSYHGSDFLNYYQTNKLTIKLIIVPNLEKLYELLNSKLSLRKSEMFFKLPEPIPFQFYIEVKKDRAPTIQLCSPYEERLNAVCLIPGGFKAENNTVQPCHLLLRNKINLDAGRTAGEYASPGGCVDLADAGFHHLESEIEAILAGHGNDLKTAENDIKSQIIEMAETLRLQWLQFQTENQAILTAMTASIEKYTIFTGGMNAIQVDFRSTRPLTPWTFVVMARAAKREAKEEALISLDSMQMVPMNRKAIKTAFDAAYTQRLVAVLKNNAEKEIRPEIKEQKISHIAEIEKNGVDPAEKSLEFRSIYFIGVNPIVAGQQPALQRCCGVGERNIYSAAQFVAIGFTPEKDVHLHFDEKEKKYRLAIITGDGTPCRAGGEFYALPIAYDALNQQQAYARDAISINTIPEVHQVHPIAVFSPLMAATSSAVESSQLSAPLPLI